MLLSARDAVEIFHLALLSELGTRLGKDRYAIKGGCNLRFFFRSPRYSEDLDLDVESIASGTLRNAVERTLRGSSLQRILAASGIQLTRWSAPKQTETTQRWKVAFETSGGAGHTKVEFSRRALLRGAIVERVDPVLTTRYGLAPVLAPHYVREAATLQKVQALVGRTQTQARDVFDLDLLLGGQPVAADLDLSDEDRRGAQERALALSFDDFKSQVVAYLPAAEQQLYDSPELWNDLVERVVDALEVRS